jgi:urease accessory protein
MNFMSPIGSALVAAQRARGRLALRFGTAAGRTRVREFYQEGCLKARLPRPVDLAVCDVVMMNISGGIAGGDVLETQVTLEPGARVCLAGQAAERVYRVLEAPSQVATRLRVQPGAVLEYLPQETILFDGFALRRSLEIALEGDAGFLGVESLIFGRLAMGEAVSSGFLRDQISLRRDGRLVLQDMTRLQGDIAAQLRGRAVAGGANAVASLIFAGPGAVEKLAALRAAIENLQAGATSFDGIVFARFLAADGAGLRRAVLAALSVLRDGRAMPGVWQG